MKSQLKISCAFSEILGLLCAEGSYILQFSSYWGNDKGKKRFYKNHKSERIEFYNKDLKLLTRMQNLLLKEFNYSPKITKRNKLNICKRDIIKNILSQTILDCLSWKVPLSVKHSDKNGKISFIRGFFDGDGTASKSIRFFSINYSGLNEIFKLLKDLNFNPYFEKPQIKKKRKPLYSLRISNTEKESFINLIKPISKLPGCGGYIEVEASCSLEQSLVKCAGLKY